jgi:ActR/RegA family two-component response regulator
VPICVQSEPAQPVATAGGERRPLHPLIVDDDATQRALISAAAGHAGHVITLAQSCSEAIEKIQATRFDCVTLDLMLEDGDGIVASPRRSPVAIHRCRARLAPCAQD